MSETGVPKEIRDLIDAHEMATFDADPSRLTPATGEAFNKSRAALEESISRHLRASQEGALEALERLSVSATWAPARQYEQTVADVALIRRALSSDPERSPT